MTELILIVAIIVVLSALLGFAGIARPLRGVWAWLLLVVGLVMAVLAFVVG